MIELKNHQDAEYLDHLAEVRQDSSIKFSLAIKEKGKDVYHKLFGLVKCRDFFNDFFIDQYQQRGNAKEIYGFYTKNYSIKGKKMYLIVSADTKEIVLSSIKEVNKNLSAYGMKELKVIIPDVVDNEDLTVHDYDYKNNQVLVDAPSYWFYNSFNINLLTYIIRYEDGRYEDEVFMTLDDYVDGDVYSLLSAVKNTPDLRKQGVVFTGYYNSECDRYYLHDMGLCYFIRNGVKAACGEQDGKNCLSKYLGESIKFKEL